MIFIFIFIQTVISLKHETSVWMCLDRCHKNVTNSLNVCFDNILKTCEMISQKKYILNKYRN